LFCRHRQDPQVHTGIEGPAILWSAQKAGRRPAGFAATTAFAAALHGDVEMGLFFRGAESLPFGQAIRAVEERGDYLLSVLSGEMPQIA
jgi:hypothetical protein